MLNVNHTVLLSSVTNNKFPKGIPLVRAEIRKSTMNDATQNLAESLVMRLTTVIPTFVSHILKKIQRIKRAMEENA
jgi:hypothetical protein